MLVRTSWFQNIIWYILFGSPATHWDFIEYKVKDISLRSAFLGEFNCLVQAHDDIYTTSIDKKTRFSELTLAIQKDADLCLAYLNFNEI